MTAIPGQPNLSQLLEETIDAASEQIRVAIPGVITSVASDLATATVQPAVRRNGSGSDPSIPEVPILWPGPVRWKIEDGASCLLIFADRSIEEWASADGARETTAGDPRTHDITDAVAIPLGHAADTASDKTGTYTRHSTTPPGTEAWGPETLELISLIIELMGVLVTESPIIDTVTTPGAILPAVFNSLAELKEKFAAIKGVAS